MAWWGGTCRLVPCPPLWGTRHSESIEPVSAQQTAPLGLSCSVVREEATCAHQAVSSAPEKGLAPSGLGFCLWQGLSTPLQGGSWDCLGMGTRRMEGLPQPCCMDCRCGDTLSELKDEFPALSHTLTLLLPLVVVVLCVGHHSAPRPLSGKPRLSTSWLSAVFPGPPCPSFLLP